MHARLRGSISLFTLYQIINKPEFPSLADEIAEPHPDMNIKAAAFTVSEKSSNNGLEQWRASIGLFNSKCIIKQRVRVNVSMAFIFTYMMNFLKWALSSTFKLLYFAFLRDHLRDNPLCDLCGMVEDANRYFFHCRKFTIERQVFNDTIKVLQPLSIGMILCGNFNLNMENNIVLFTAVHRYIHATKRFKTSWLFVWSFPWNILSILISILMTNMFYSQVKGVPGSRTIFFFFFIIQC